MKKINIVSKKGVAEITLYPSAEAAYVWLMSDESEPAGEVVPLLSGEFIEVEWMGCECTYEKNDCFRVDKVRMVRARPTQNSMYSIISIHVGWVTECDLDFCDSDNNEITITRLPPGVDVFDMDELFECDEDNDEDE
jgi:hypothetical protein